MILAGGTGGHVFPAAAVGVELSNLGYKVCWAGKSGGLEENQAHNHNIDFIAASSPVWQRKSVFAKFYVLFELMKAIYRSWFIMQECNPKTVIGFGGAISVALGICAAFQGRKLIIHEQNAKAGKANKLLSLFSKKIMLGFPGAFRGRKVVVAGNPIREDIVVSAEASPKKELKAPFKVLVLGGSQGSVGLNSMVVEAFSQLGQDFEIWHQAGKGVEETQRGYESIGKDAHVVEFIDNVAEAYAWADLVISRAGALTITEILAYGLPSVLVPNPHSADNHQHANALYVAGLGAAVAVSEQEGGDAVSARILYMLTNPKYYMDMRTAAEKLAVTDGVGRIMKVCLDVSEVV